MSSEPSLGFDTATPPPIGVIDYGMGNLHSALKGLQRAGADAYLVEKPTETVRASGLVLPGVGNFGRCMQNLRSAGFVETVRTWIESGRPFLGICLGLQMLYASSDEADEPGLGVVASRVLRLPSRVRVPHMGWNTVDARTSPGVGGGGSTPTLATAAKSGEYFYFVHSYAALEPPPDSEVVLTTAYGADFVSGFQRGSIWATQFHPEKSGAAGIALLEAFVGECASTDKVPDRAR